MNRASSASSVTLRRGQTLLKAVREIVRNTGEVFVKWLNGSLEAKSALNNVAKYVARSDKRMDGKLLSCLPFGMMALRPVSDSDDSAVVLASLSCLGSRELFLCWGGFLAVLVTGLTIRLR